MSTTLASSGAMASMLARTAEVAKPASGAFAGRTAPAALPRRSLIVAKAKAGNWFPGTDSPAYLDGSLPGDFGFDPFSLGENPVTLQWYQQAELQHGRWAMLGAAGVLFPEVLASLGQGGPAAATPWYDAGKFEFFAPASALFGVQFFLMSWVELRRLQDMKTPGSTNVDPIYTNNKLPDNNSPGYPGGIFDPLGFSKGNVAEYQLKELKNGRLAMMAFAGFVVQHITTGTTPLKNLGAHLSDPWGINVVSNELARAGN